MGNPCSVVELPKSGYAPNNQAVADHLREQASWMDEEGACPVRNVFLVIEYEDGSLVRSTCGQPCDLGRAIGVLTMAISQAATGVERA